VGEVHPSLYRGGRSTKALGFELEIKSEFSWKTKSRKIRRLELISDKIEGRDRMREVMCIRFGHPMKKNEIVWGSPWEASHGRSWSSMAGHWELAGEGKEGKGEDGGGGGGTGVGRHGEREGYRRRLLGATWLGPLLVWPLLVREGRKEKRRKWRERKRRERRRKRKKWENM
jgi:hypothetical protein